jgi:hypothetical protein
MNQGTRILTYGRRLHQVPGTFHADTFLWSYEERLYVIKQIGKRYAHFTPEIAHTLAHLLCVYYERLHHLRIPVPEEFACWVDDETVFCLSRYCGKPLRALLETGGTLQAIHLIETVLAIIAELFHWNDLQEEEGTSASSWLTLSLDVSPDNFTVDGTQMLRYVDFTPPLLKMRRDEAFLEAFVPTVQCDEHPTWKNFRYFNQKGIMLTFLTKFWAAWPQHYRVIHDHLAQFLCQPRYQSVLYYLRACPAIHVYRLLHEGRAALHAGYTAGVEQRRSALHHLIALIPAAERDQLRLCVLLLTPTHLEWVDDHFWKQHELLASARENHAHFFQTVFACYKSSHTHRQLQQLVMSLVDLALMHHPRLTFRQFDTALVSLLLSSS